MRGRWFAATLWPYGAARRPHHPTAAPRRRPRGVRPDGRGPGPRHRGTGHRPRRHRGRLAAAQLRPRHAGGRGHRRGEARRLRGGLERPVCGCDRAARVARSRDRDLAGALDPERGASSGWFAGRDAGAVGQRWGPAARAASLPRGLDVLGARAAGRRGDRAAAAAPWLRGARVCAGRGAGRVPGGRGRLQRVAEPDSVDVRGLGGRCGPSAGVRVVEPARRHRPGRCRRRGRVRVPQPGLRLRPVPRRSSRPARSGLARALLVDCFAVAREHGASRSELSTDSRTGALGLYERVGMRVTSTWVHRAIAL